MCRLLITFANSLDQDQDRQNVGPDLDRSKLFDTLMVFLKEFFRKKLIFQKIQQMTKKHAKLPSMQRVKLHTIFALITDLLGAYL